MMYLARWSTTQPLAKSLQSRLNFNFIGLNTLILLGLNGLFLEVVNDPLAAALAPYIPDTQLAMVTLCSLFTAISLLVCVPAVLGLKKYVPQLVGLPKVEGPILRRLL